ncbi:MAG TPA: bifunctional (p)ppGpp synthetase/guanosine-3',5'-bis(diphosphate) 3'-pyrophosphohydrolase [Burkholderiales bacterium]|nr:bifunctional (p)ppGpp synthetase/guanosine-3',5'-bis(diphosphate) 3'-pyrophosphohydrolase [Burkholderiales bacterium]
MVTVKHGFNDIDSWLITQKEYFNEEHIKQFADAISIAQKYYRGQKFYPTNIDLLEHALTCAKTVSGLNLYSDAVIATILFALPKYCPTWQNEIKGFAPNVLELIDGINRVIQIRKFGALATEYENTSERKEQIEIVRKMLLAMASDIRVVLIVLVGRGELMLHLKSCKDVSLQRKIAEETVNIFAPLANRLGVSHIKWELEDLSFKYLHPEQYKKIAQLLDETRQERLEYIERIKEFLSGQIEAGGIEDYQLMGRAKHIYSIWKKMKKKNYDFTDLYDIHALRVLVPEVKDCYTVLGIVHTKYSPIPGEFDDYISNPKSNNYQSLHTCVIGPENKIVEIQIRTFAMHDHAEYGIAAHWRYKEFGDKGVENSQAFAEKVAWLRQLLDWREELTERKDITNIFKNEIFNDTIYVMTPNGKVISLPKGATPIDFAYAVHSDIGNKCRGAKVDGQIVPLSTILRNGQRVEVLTVKDGGPSINWLHEGLVKSSKAISHIRRYIRNQNNEEFLLAGSEIFERELSKFPANIRPPINEIISKLGFDNEKNMCIDLGKGDLLPATIRDAIKKLLIKPEINSENINSNSELEFIEPLTPKESDYKYPGILVDGVSGIVTAIAKCCKPMPNDNIMGFITHGKGVVIHRSNCSGLKRQAKLFPKKVVPVNWGLNVKNATFTLDIEIIANDRSGLLRDLTDLFALEKLNIAGLRTICKNNKAFMVFTIKVSGENFNFDWLINKIFRIQGVIEASRK